MLSAKCKFGKNWLCGSGEGVFYFVIQSLEKGVTTSISFIQGSSVQNASLVKIDPVNVVIMFSLFCYYIIWKKTWSFIKKT